MHRTLQALSLTAGLAVLLVAAACQASENPQGSKETDDVAIKAIDLLKAYKEQPLRERD